MSQDKTTEYDPKRVPYYFTSKELDKETGLYYYGARYYDPRTSVWQSPDPILGKYLSFKGNGGISTSFNLNLYAYSFLNPIKLTDPDGAQPQTYNSIGEFFSSFYKDSDNYDPQQIHRYRSKHSQLLHCSGSVFFLQREAYLAVTKKYPKLHGKLGADYKYWKRRIKDEIKEKGASNAPNPLQVHNIVKAKDLAPNGKYSDYANYYYDGEVIDTKFNSKNIEPGDIGIFVYEGEDGAHSGHAITVIGVERDEITNEVISITTIEGYAGSPPEELYTETYDDSYTDDDGNFTYLPDNQSSNFKFKGWFKFNPNGKEN